LLYILVEHVVDFVHKIRGDKIGLEATPNEKATEPRRAQTKITGS